MTRKRVAGWLLAFALAPGARAGADDDQQAVLAAQDRRVALTVSADLPALGALMTDDLTWTHSNAVVETRAEFLAALRTGKYRYKTTTFDERRVRLHGETAIVSGTCRVQVATGGRDIDVELRFTELYVKRQGAWKMALWHSTRVPDAAP